jgi:hypothetical protein
MNVVYIYLINKKLLIVNNIYYSYFINITKLLINIILK